MSDNLKLALFDFDGTLCAGNTLHLFMQDQISSLPKALQIGFWAIVRKTRLIDSRRFKEGVLGVTKGWTSYELDRLGLRLYHQRVRPLLRCDGLRELERLRREGYRVVVVTGAFDFLVAPFCMEFEVMDCLSCRVAMAGAVCSGHIDGLEMLGSDKPEAVRAHFKNQPVDWAGCVAFTDDLGDLPFLELAGHRFLVAGTRCKVPTGVKKINWT